MMWSASPRGVHDENHNAIKKPQRLQAQFAVRVTPVFTRNRERREDRFAANEIKAVIADVGLALGFIVGNHCQIVDAI
jgi:hypothetical protein